MGSITRKFKLKDLDDKNYKFVCKECCRETSHNIVSSYEETGSEDCGGGNSVDWYSQSQIIQCLGCETVSFRVTSTFSEDYDHEYDYDKNEHVMVHNETVKYYPGRTEGLKAINIYLLPEKVQSIYQETILAIENEQNVLAGIGIRALIETICKDQQAEGRDLIIK